MYLQKFDLEGKTALVTGGARGIGAACVDALLEAGASVIVADYSRDNLDESKGRLGGAKVSFEIVDVTDPQAVEKLARRVGPVDVLVNNAGIGRQTAAEDTTDQEWREVMDINLNGVFWCARAFGRQMIARGSGSIVNVGSMAGVIAVRPQKTFTTMLQRRLCTTPPVLSPLSGRHGVCGSTPSPQGSLRHQ